MRIVAVIDDQMAGGQERRRFVSIVVRGNLAAVKVREKRILALADLSNCSGGDLENGAVAVLASAACRAVEIAGTVEDQTRCGKRAVCAVLP